MNEPLVLFGSRLSPFVEKVARALRWKALAFTVTEPSTPWQFARWNPQTRKIPVLQIGRERVYDSTFIVRRLDHMRPDPPLLGSHPQVAAAQRLLEDWSDESLYWHGMALRWTPQNAAATARQIFSKLPAWLRPAARIFGPRQIRASTVAQGLGRLPEEVLLRELAVRLDDLVVLLDERPFFYSDRPSIADFAIYGQFHMLASGPTPHAEELLRARTSLIAHMRRLESLTRE